MIRAFLLLCISLFISACSTNSKQTIIAPSSVNSITQWQATGRVGIRTSDDAISGNFNWHHSPQGFSLVISGPFGQGTTKLSQDDSQQVILEYKDIKATGSNPELLLKQHFGWQFPVSQIAYWARGLAEPSAAAAFSYNVESQHLEELVQDGWTVTYKEYTQVQGLTLPRKLQAVKAPFRVNLIINDWTIQ
jgi:outer membrane lipoprotein LolB